MQLWRLPEFRAGSLCHARGWQQPLVYYIMAAAPLGGWLQTCCSSHRHTAMMSTLGPQALQLAPPRRHPHTQRQPHRAATTPHSAPALVQDYSVQQLEVGYETGADRLVMWLPVVVRHVITPESPLASWLQPGGTLADADSCILVVVRP